MRDGAPWSPLHMAAILAAGVTIIAAFMPWAKAEVLIFTVTVDGMDRDGMLTLFLAAGIIAAVFASLYLGLPMRQASIAIAILGAGIALVGGLTWIDIEGAVDVDGTELEALPGIEATPEIGLYLTTGAGLAALLLGIAGFSFAKPGAEPG